MEIIEMMVYVAAVRRRDRTVMNQERHVTLNLISVIKECRLKYGEIRNEKSARA